MSVRYAILGLLAARPLHGYELKAAYHSEFLPTSDLNFGQVYATLERLLRDQLVDCEVVPQPARPERKIYTITKLGLAELKSWLDSSSALPLDLRTETFFKLVVAGALASAGQPNVGNSTTIIARERKRALAQLHEVLHTPKGAGEARPAETLLLSLAELKLEAYLKWLDRAEELANAESSHPSPPPRGKTRTRSGESNAEKKEIR